MITTITNSVLTAQINHSGAEVCSLKDNSTKEYIWEGNPVYWGKHSPILFPIVGTLKDNFYLYDGKEYQLPRHGFARDMDFNLIEKKESSATFSLKSNAETMKKYPFDFDLQVIYTLENKSLIIEYKVINNDSVKMPFSIGAHPAFALPGNFENYSLEFEDDKPLHYFLLNDGLISNTTAQLPLDKKQLHLNYKLFENDALVFKTIPSNSITILENSVPILKVNYKGFPNLGIWTPQNAPFICIEPWFGYSDTEKNFGNLFEKEGIQILEPNCNFHSEFSIVIM